MERDLLERMVQERDEKNKTLQKTIDMQKEYISGLQGKTDREQERQKQQAARQKLYLQSITHEKNLISSQLKVLQKENTRIKNDPIHRALTQPGPAPTAPPLPGLQVPNSETNGVNGVNGHADSVDDQDSIDSMDSSTNGEEKKTLSPNINIFDGDQRCLVLQSQLYQAMNSLSTLQKQTSALKGNYDEIVTSLQQEVMETEESAAKMEVKLLSRMTVLEREKTIIEELLQEKIRTRDARLKRLEKRLQNLDSINDDESLDAQDVFIIHHGESPTDGDSVHGVYGDDKSEITENVSNKQDFDRSHEGIDGLLTELEMLSAHSSSKKLFSDGVEWYEMNRVQVELAGIWDVV